MTEETPARGETMLLRSLPFVVMSIIAVIDLLAGPGVGYLPLLSLGPAFASLAGSVVRTAGIGALALVLCAALAVYDDLLGTRTNNLTLASIAGVIVAGMAAALLRERKERELSDVRTVAEVAQRVLLRPVPRRVGPIHAAVRYISAAARARIGGDLYEIVTTPDGVRLIVGDVQGKGLEAVETAAVVLAVFREAAYDEPDLLGVVVRLEKALSRHLPGEGFVTAVLADVDHTGTITLLNCGHPAPLRITADGRVEPAEPPQAAPPLGILSLVGESPVPYKAEFLPEDRLLFYTDGVIEARDRRGTFYPLLDRAVLLRQDDPETALDELQADLVRHAGGVVRDDAAMLLLGRRGH